MKHFALALAMIVFGFAQISLAESPTGPATPVAAAKADAELQFANVTALVYWEQGPSENGESIMRLEFVDKVTQTPVVLGESLSVDLWMDDMGHGSAPTAIQRTLDDQGNVRLGVYRVLNMYFMMKGDWDVRVTLADTSGYVETQTLRFSEINCDFD